MEVHMIGHASLYIETENCRFLMDPVFWDPFYEGNNEVSPKRDIERDKIPEFDVLIISHKHLDHFDIRTLATLPKTVEVLIPRDKLLENYLRRLGYSKIRLLKDFEEVKFGSTTLWTTRSEMRVPEFGMIFADSSGILWNQVDTLTLPNTISSVLSRFGKIDLLLATWQPLLEDYYQTNKSIAFPYKGYNGILYNISLIKPKGIVPASCGFRYFGSSSWLNKIMFPVIRERFCEDVKELCPELENNIFPLDPGDILKLSDNKFSCLPAACEYVKKVEDNPGSTIFCPVKIDTELKDPNPHSYPLENLKVDVEEEISCHLTKFIRENWISNFLEHQKWKVIYQLEITFPDNSIQQWFFDFTKSEIKVQKGFNPLANFFTYITASGLCGFLKGTMGREYVMDGGFYRSFQKVYAVTPFGIISPLPPDTILEDPLVTKFFAYNPNSVSNSVLDREMEKWANSIDNDMLNNGNGSQPKLSKEKQVVAWNSLFS